MVLCSLRGLYREELAEKADFPERKEAEEEEKEEAMFFL